MAYRKKIKVNILSPASIAEAVKELEAQSAEMEKLKEAFLSSLADKAEKFLRDLYGASFTVTADADSNMIMVMVEGYGLLFYEFGTGLYADESQGGRWGYRAGSWSETHERTWQYWVEQGYPLEKYPYAHEGRDYFLQLETHLSELIRKTADEVFK